MSLQQQQQKAEGEGFTAGWQAPAAAEVLEDVTQEGLHRLLLRFGINTAVVDRYVVAQSRQAVEVQDPLRLVAHLEVGVLGEGGEVSGMGLCRTRCGWWRISRWVDGCILKEGQAMGGALALARHPALLSTP